MDAEPVARFVGQRIHEPVDERSFRRNEFRVLAAARIDGEALAAQQRRDLVGVEAGRVDDDARGDRFAPGPEAHAGALAIGADEPRPGQHDDAGRFAIARERLDERFGFDDAAVGDQRAATALTAVRATR